MKRHWFLIFVAAATLFGCNIADDAVQTGNNSNNGADAGPNDAGTTDSGNNATDAGSTDAGDDASCVPANCSAEQCGMIDDGCGGMLDCGPCECTDDNFETFCPDMPCMVATGCGDDGTCTYGPVSCNGLECSCADPENCRDDELRRCSDGALTCPADFCDPQPTANPDGTMSFGNACVNPDGAACDFADLCTAGACSGNECVRAECGTCNLGRWDCVDNAPACFDVPEIAVASDAANCNDRTADSTFIYVDHTVGVDDAGSGSRSQPFLTLQAAYAAAESRGAAGVVVRDGYTLNAPLTLVDGISILGGFSGVPDWINNDGRLAIDVPDQNSIGVDAVDLGQTTVLHNVDITLGAPDQLSAYGVRAVRAPGLVLSNVTVQASEGSRGSNGANGRPGATGDGGGDGSGRSPGTPGFNRACPAANGGIGGQGGRTGGAGATGATSALGSLGGPGGPPGAAGGPGQTSRVRTPPGNNGDGATYGYRIENDLWVPEGVGNNGDTGAPGPGGGGGGGGGGPVLIISGSGGGGGGGGAGGCGGFGGSGGRPGGSSFGVFAIDSTGMRIIGTSTIRAGAGGVGGDGGSGGPGGAPGGGGRGGAPNNGGPGGVGGNGVIGGTGGAGGGGAGGDSVAVHCEGTTIDLSSPDLTLEFSAPGDGGAAPNPGEAGRAAASRGCE